MNIVMVTIMTCSWGGYLYLDASLSGRVGTEHVVLLGGKTFILFYCSSRSLRSI